MLDMRSLRLEDEQSGIADVPLDILLIIFSYLNTARSVASLAATCKKLHSVVQANGWRIFVRTHFESLSLPQDIKDEAWIGWARHLTSQSRSWDRRAFTAASFVAPVKQPPRGARGGTAPRLRFQTVPPHIVVDASSTFEGGAERETVAWGAGEDVVVRRRYLGPSASSLEAWMATEGASLGFKSGKDDVTALSILQDSDSGVNLLLGRASGHLQVLSMDHTKPGQVLASLQPASADGSPPFEQKDIQAFDTSYRDSALVITKENLFIYPLNNTSLGTDQSNDSSNTIVEPNEAINLRLMPDSRQFRSLRAITSMGNGDIALGMTSSPQPLRYFKKTPTGLELINAAKLRPSNRCTQSYIHDDGHLQTVRSLLPVNCSSVLGGSGHVVLGSYDDGTIRLQDLRSPSSIDTIYQDHFEVLTPVGPLVSHGMERFIAGSARTSTLKFFDFRWTKSYHYTDALPCDKTPLAPTPRAPTMVPFPSFPDVVSCDHRLGRSCKCHALARTDFYRPNCNVYLPANKQSASPIYSLARASDLSSTVYAGMAGELVSLRLRDQADPRDQGISAGRREWRDRAGYGYHESFVSIIETGDGIALNDISKSHRVPEIRKQSYRHPPHVGIGKMYRLDDLLM